MNRWQCRQVPFNFQLSDWTLFSISMLLQVRAESPFDETSPMDVPAPPTEHLMKGSQGFLVRGMPVAAELPPISLTGDYLCYVPLQYQHYYIDFGLSFEDYQKKFSSKARSTISRKIRRFSEHCGGTIIFKTYKLPDEIRNFFRFARIVSKLTYQERFLKAGIPDSDDFIRHAELLAADQQLRAYILFDCERPVSYLYCPVQDGVLSFSYLGYDPDYMQMSVGTVLQWLAIEQLFIEARFRYFDFTEGQSDHKRLFATHQRQCANIFLVKKTLRNNAVIYSHLLMNRFSTWLGVKLEQLGLKAKIKRYLRFAR